MKKLIAAAVLLIALAQPAQAFYCPPPVVAPAAVGGGSTAPIWPWLFMLGGIELMVYAEANQIDPWTGTFDVVEYSYPR